MAIVTVSRLYGSGGSEVAALVAKDLGWALLDNSVIDAVAARLGITASEVAAREERAPSWVERLTEALTLGSQDWLPAVSATRRGPTDEQLVDVTRHIVEEAIARGPLVIVGRGAQAMLAERSDALHVFCYSPRAALITRTMERERISSEAATQLVDDTNALREQWVKKHWGRSWREHSNYHISLNTEWLGVPDAARLVCSAAREMFSPSEPESLRDSD